MQNDDNDNISGSEPKPRKGPWDNSPGDTTKGKAAKPTKGAKSAGEPAATGDTEPAPKPKSANPWASDNTGPADKKRQTGSAGLEELLRRAGGTGNWGNMPSGPGGKSVWPMIAGAMILLWILWSSVHRIDPGEKGVVTRFGKYVRTVDNGISFSLPAPVERLIKVDTQQSRYTLVGSPQASDENLVLTKDQNLIDLAFQVAWNVSDPEKFLFQMEEPDDLDRDETIKAVAETAMRATIANFGYDAAVGGSRQDIEASVRERMQVILDKYGAGIRVQSIAIKQSDPPDQTKEAFDKVTAAQQQRESNLSKARAYAAQVKQRAEGDTAEFDRIYTQYSAAPEVTKRRIYYETMESILGSVDKTIVESGSVQSYLPLPELKKRVEAAATETAKAKEAAQ